MPEIRQTAEFNTFIGGLVTETSPLNFPENASLDELNMELNKDGSRNRRLGLDYEDGYSIIDSGTSPLTGERVTTNYFEWRNAGGFPNKIIGVVQINNVLKFLDLDDGVISNSVIHTETIQSSSGEDSYSFASEGGVLVVALGSKDVTIFTYDGAAVSTNTVELRIRDLFGVEDIYEGEDITLGNNIIRRPTTLSDTHNYNLRNQTFGSKHPSWDEDTRFDPLSLFKSSKGVYPSNADNIHTALYSRASKSTDPISRRFDPDVLINESRGTTPAPKGRFVINAMSRGASRKAAAEDLATRLGGLTGSFNALPTDLTPGGATVVGQYAGRVWYGGFSDEVVSGDSKSPRMASYILFSRLVKDPSDIGECYQSGDPTSYEEPDLVGSDGGFIKLDGAFKIKRMVSIGTSLVVLAENGVWSVSGGTDTGFDATAYIVRKISSNGILGKDSVVEVDNTLMYWSEDGIYHITPNNYGELSSSNISYSKIQKFYDRIPPEDKALVKAAYDSFKRRIYWVYSTKISNVSDTKELVLDVGLGAFYPRTLRAEQGSPKVVLPVAAPPYKIGSIVEDVVAGSDLVVSGVEQVEVTLSFRDETISEVSYLTLVGTTPSITFTFSRMSNTTFTDWDISGFSIPYQSYLLTGYLTGGDTQRDKKIGYLTTHFTRTENGFEDDGTGTLIPSNPSGCLLSSQWNWTDSPVAGRWSTPRQVYRYNRLYMPSGISDAYDNGDLVLTTKNKIRGKGKSVSFLFEAEEGKDMVLLGWALTLGGNSNV